MFQVSFNNFLKEIKNLKLFAANEEVSLIRFFFTREKIFSITMPISKLEFNMKGRIFLPDALPLINAKYFLLPCYKTAFRDPCAVQPTLCVMSSEFEFLGEDLFLDEKSIDEKFFKLSGDEMRNPLKKSQEIKSTVTIQFIIDEEDGEDFFSDNSHDLRSDIVLEMLKSGIEVFRHNSNIDGKCEITCYR